MIHLEQLKLIDTTGNHFFVYEINKGNTQQLGLLCLVSLEDYGRGKIKGHEQRLSSKVETLQRQMLEGKIDRQPVLLLEKENSLSEFLKTSLTNAKLVKEQCALDGGRHRLFAIHDKSRISDIEKFGNTTRELFIADGHHRLEAAYRNFRSESSHDEFASAVILSVSDAVVKPFFKVVSSVSRSRHQILNSLESSFERVDKSFYRQTRDFAVVLSQNDVRYFRSKHVHEALSQESVLRQICEVTEFDDTRQINYVPGEVSLENLGASLKQDSVGFAFPCPSAKEIISLAERGEIVPPHSTCFLNKPLQDFACRDKPQEAKISVIAGAHRPLTTLFCKRQEISLLASTRELECLETFP